MADSTQDVDAKLAEIRRQQDAAANLVRAKLEALYKKEPDVEDEIETVTQLQQAPNVIISKHQQFMQELSTSGRGLAEIQAAWHEYYQALPDEQKHEVWNEFYSAHERSRTGVGARESSKPPIRQAQDKQVVSKEVVKQEPKSAPQKAHSKNYKHRAQPKLSTDAIKQELLGRVRKRSRPKMNHHAKSLLFGLGMGSLMVFILLFSFFNERFITPFIRPNMIASATPIIVDPTNLNAPVSPEPKIILPKIGVEAPVVYDVPTIEEKAVQKGLERGVVHYATTPNPGERGNAVIFGHSSGNILNKGQYKFAFLLLKSHEIGDTFIIHRDSKQYVYKIYEKYITSPTDLSVLNPRDKPATVTLITCDPPGLSTNRLIIVAEQIFPNPQANAPSALAPEVQQPKELPSNSPSLWHRIFGGG